MSEQLKPCPFCGGEQVTSEAESQCLPYHACDYCGDRSNDWNTRPIEDALRARIAELERMQLRLIENANNLIQLANFNNPKAVEYCEQHTQLMREIQPPEICKTCGGSGTVHWKYDDPDYDAEVDASAPCPDCKPEDK